MKHWIVDSRGELLGNWKEAFPRAKMVTADQLVLLANPEDGVIWLRLFTGADFTEISRISALTRGLKVVVLADDPDEALVLNCLEQGAFGCCNTHAAAEVLRQVALVVSNGGLWIGQPLLRQLLGSTSRLLENKAARPPRNDWGLLLSEREVQVARLVASGASNKEIAHKLAVTERTVKAHLTAIFEKLGLRDRLQLSLRVNGVSS